MQCDPLARILGTARECIVRTRQMKEEQQWECYASSQNAGMTACSGMQSRPWWVMLKRRQRFKKPSGSLPESEPRARRLFGWSQANRSSAWSSLTPRPRRLSWSHEWLGVEHGSGGGGFVRGGIGRSDPGAWGAHRSQLVRSASSEAPGGRAAQGRIDPRPIRPPDAAGPPRYCQPQRSRPHLPCAKGSWARAGERKGEINDVALSATA